MTNRREETRIKKLISDLKSDEDYIRRNSIDAISEELINDKKIINALIEIATNDPNKAIRSYAENALYRLGIEMKQETKDAVKKNLISENNPSPAGKSIGTILAIAGILFLISFFVGDGETAGFLQCFVIPGAAFIAIVLALLIVNINNPTIKETSSAQVRRDESTPLVEGEPAENVKEQQSEEVGSTLNAAFLSGMAGVLFVIAVVYLINDNKVPFDSLNNLILLVCIFVVPIFSLIGVAIHKSRRSKK